MASARTICTRLVLTLAAWHFAGVLVAEADAFRNPSTRPLPVLFEANQGQTDPQVKFLVRGSGYNLFLTSTEAVLDLRTVKPPKRDWRMPTSKLVREREQMERSRVTAPSIVRMRIVAADPKAPIITGEAQRLKVNYFRGTDRSRWLRNVPTYDQVRYKDMYPGIDLVYYQKQGKPAYDFVVGPGSDPRAITLEFDGARKVSIAPGGDLVIDTPAREIRQSKPVIYQNIAGVREPVPGHFVKKGPNRVGFQILTYVANLPIVIDPTLSDLGPGVAISAASAVDGTGNTIVVGYTESVDFPATNGTTFQGGALNPVDGFVAKTDAAGTILWATYLGGDGPEFAEGVAVDAAGNAYVVGRTHSTNFPVGLTAPPSSPSPFQLDNEGGADAFLAKLDTDGALLYSTYFGGSGDEAFTGIVLDASGRPECGGVCIHVAGGTSSGGFRATDAGQLSGAITATDTSISLSDASSFPNSGIGQIEREQFSWSSKTDNTLNGLMRGVNGTVAAAHADQTAVYEILGSDPDFIGASGRLAGAGAMVRNLGGGGDVVTINGIGDAFVAKFTSGFGLVYFTMFGGTGSDFANALAVDAAGNVSLTGESLTAFPAAPVMPCTVTDSPTSDYNDFIVTTNALQACYGGGDSDAFVVKVDSTGALFYSSYLGGSGFEFGTSVSTGSIVLTGYTSSQEGFPTVAALQSTNAGPLGTTDAYIVHITDPTDPATQPEILFSTYFGGSGDDLGSGIAINSAGEIYVAGTTASEDFPVVNSTTTAAGIGEVFVAKISTTTGTEPTLVYSVVPKDAEGNPVEASFSLSTPISISPSGEVVVAGTTGGLAVVVPDVSFALDVKPTINPKAKGKIPVTILASGNFDVTQLDLTVPFTFGRTGTEQSLLSCGKPNNKGLTCHFDAQTSGFQIGDTIAHLHAQTVPRVTPAGPASGVTVNLQGPIRTVKK